MHVSALSVTPVKGTRLLPVNRVRLDRHGVRENRRFFLVDERDRMVNAKNIGQLQTLVTRYDDESRQLEVEFPDGRVMTDAVRVGEPVTVRFFSDEVSVRPVLGDFSETISAHVGRDLRLVEADGDSAVDRGAVGAVSLISRASLARLAQEGALDWLDPRRFRMLIEVDGVEAHGEDEWVGGHVAVGEALVRVGGHVGRCLITSRDPDTGVVDVPTLDILGTYRRDAKTTEPLPFGIYGEVVEPGAVAVGDRLELSDG